MRKFSELIRLSHFGQDRDSATALASEQQRMVTQEARRQKRISQMARLAFAPVVVAAVAVISLVVYPRIDVVGAELLKRERPPQLRNVEAEPSVDPLSLAVLNPNNMAAARELVPAVMPVADNDDGDGPAGLEGIVVVTPTPEEPQNAADAAGVDSVEAASPTVSGTSSGIIPAGQQRAAPSVETEPTVDTATLSELVTPLLNEQVEPKPLVIQLDIPPVVPQGPQGGLEGAGLRAPSDSSAFPQILLLPTATPTGASVQEVASAVGIPVVEIVPAVGVKPTPTPTLAPTPTSIPEPTPLWSDNGPEVGRKWSSFTPISSESNDHFWVANPFADISANGFASPNYQFGSTAGGRYRPHHGVDISNPSGTPIQAGVAGEVVFAGPDDVDVLGPYPDFYGNAVVIRLDRKLPVAGGRLDVYLLYGHLSDVRTTVGARIQPSDVIGLVGMTGIAIGPHLHVEIRLGANSYSHNVNPYLWMDPPDGAGAVAVRLVSKEGRTWAGAKISIARFQGGAAVWARQIETYLDTENIGPDPAWGENGAMGDVPAGYYYLIGEINGEDVRAEFTVEPGRTTFVEVRTQQ